MSRIAASLDATPFLTGRASFAALLAEIAARGWIVEHDAGLPFYGPFWIVAPHGEFSGHGFGRADSLRLAFDKAVAAESAA